MAYDALSNFSYETVTTAPSPATTGTTMVIGTTNYAQFPDPSTSGSYNCVAWPAGTFPLASNSEVVRVVGKATVGTLYLSRNAESSGTRTIGTGDQFAMNITTKRLTDIQGVLSGSVTPSVGTLNNAILGTPLATGGSINNSTLGTPKIISPYKMRAYPAGTQGVPQNADTLVTLATEDYDTNNNFATSTYTAPVNGYYFVAGRVTYDVPTVDKRYWCKLWQNGTAAGSLVVSTCFTAPATNFTVSPMLASTLYMVANDTLGLYTRTDSGTPNVINNGAEAFGAQTELSITLLSQ